MINNESTKLVAIVDYRIDDEIKKNLKNNGISEIIYSYKNNNVDISISGHVDISLYYDGKKFISAPEAYEYYLDIFKEKDLNVSIEKGYKTLTNKYPNDVLYNVCSIGNIHIANFDYVDKSIIDRINIVTNDRIIDNREKKMLDSNRVNTINNSRKISIKQGYANCSILAIDEKSFITSDQGIYNVLIKENFDVLKIGNGHISLFDMEYGFIGGASAVFGNNVYFFGNIDNHPNSIKIKDFISKRGKKIISLGDKNLVDYGSMYIFET